MASSPPSAPRHPSLDRRALIAWPGYKSGLSVDSINRAVVGAIAKPLAHAVQEPTQIERALNAEMGLLLPPQSWRNQLPVDHPKRHGAFAGLPVSRPGIEFDPENRQPAGFLERYAADHLQSEIDGRATLLTTPCHVLEDECGAGRRCDLRLAQLTAEEFRARRGWTTPGETEARELYASLIVQGRHVREPGVVDKLVDAYAGLDVTGYLVIGANYTKSGIQASGYTELALRLQILTGRPAVIACVGFSQLAFLASGIAATWSGLHGMSFSYPPESLTASAADEMATGADAASVSDDTDDDDDKGLGMFVYHRDLLGYVGQLGADGDPVRVAIFQNRPCRCGFHAPTRPPTKQSEIIKHNAWCVSADAEELVSVEVAEAEHRLIAKVDRATRLREFVRATGISTDFLGVIRAARRLRGASSADEELG